MRTLVLGLAVSALLLTGCARHYVMRLNNGALVTTSSKPKLKGGFYVYKDASGRENAVWQGRVAEIGPASQMSKEGSQFKPQPAR